MLTGDSGIITNAQKAKLHTEIAEVEEVLNMEYVDLKANRMINGTGEETLAGAVTAVNTKYSNKYKIENKSAGT